MSKPPEVNCPRPIKGFSEGFYARISGISRKGSYFQRKKLECGRVELPYESKGALVKKVATWKGYSWEEGERGNVPSASQEGKSDRSKEKRKKED